MDFLAPLRRTIFKNKPDCDGVWAKVRIDDVGSFDPNEDLYMVGVEEGDVLIYPLREVVETQDFSVLDADKDKDVRWVHLPTPSEYVTRNPGPIIQRLMNILITAQEERKPFTMPEVDYCSSAFKYLAYVLGKVYAEVYAHRFGGRLPSREQFLHFMNEAFGGIYDAIVEDNTPDTE